MNISGTVIEVGMLDAGMGVVIRRKDYPSNCITLVGLSMDETRALAQLLDEEVTITTRTAVNVEGGPNG